MGKLQCFRCGYESSRSANFIRHLRYTRSQQAANIRKFIFLFQLKFYFWSPKSSGKRQYETQKATEWAQLIKTTFLGEAIDVFQPNGRFQSSGNSTFFLKKLDK